MNGPDFQRVSGHRSQREARGYGLKRQFKEEGLQTNFTAPLQSIKSECVNGSEREHGSPLRAQTSRTEGAKDGKMS